MFCFSSCEVTLLRALLAFASEGAWLGRPSRDTPGARGPRPSRSIRVAALQGCINEWPLEGRGHATAWWGAVDIAGPRPCPCAALCRRPTSSISGVRRGGSAAQRRGVVVRCGGGGPPPGCTGPPHRPPQSQARRRRRPRAGGRAAADVQTAPAAHAAEEGQPRTHGDQGRSEHRAGVGPVPPCRP